MSGDMQRFEEMFDQILVQLSGPDDKHARCIVMALQVVALELSELNSAASSIMEASDHLPAVLHHLERIANRD
jgi:hypothetical protein